MAANGYIHMMLTSNVLLPSDLVLSSLCFTFSKNLSSRPSACGIAEEWKWYLVTQHLLESCLSGASCHKVTASGSSLRHEPQCIFTCPSSFYKRARRLRQCEEKSRCACFLH